MNARHTQVKQIFEAACLEAPSERFAFVARACAHDQALRHEVESLLAFYDDDADDSASLGRKRARRTPASRYRRGRVLAGRYRVERWLGAGGMGEVYAVYDGLLRQSVALKVLHRTDPLFRSRLIDEVRLARQVTHPAVCRVYDIGEDDGTPFLTMELIDGENLSTRLARSGPLPSAEVIHIATRLAEALAAAHEAGILHRDLKPSNVMIARRGGIHLTDFGISTSRACTDGGGGKLGTPAYMAPEET
jgi:serine/threonine-protein kinase